MMTTDILKLVGIAEDSLESMGSVPRSGGWMLRHTARSPYRAAHFNLDGESWAVCQGDQSAGYARLLDATVAYMKEIGATAGISILKRPQRPNRNSREPDEAFLRRLQTAAWTACNVIWIAKGCQPGTWPRKERFDKGDLGEIVTAMQAALAPTSDLTQLTGSRNAEKWILPRLDKVMKDRNYVRSSRSFYACWRLAITDGAWRRTTGRPTSLAVEVKFKEDIEAPLCQVVDDVCQYDAVVCIRIRTKVTRDRLGLMPPTYSEAIRAAEEALPIRFVNVDV